MTMVTLDRADRSLLNILQSAFPLVEEPFAQIGLQMSMGEEEVIQRILRLKDEQIIRNIGPIFDSRKLGYRSTLVAMHVPQRRLEQAAVTISRHPGVSHNYQRKHYYNVWFTLTVSDNDGESIEAHLLRLKTDVNPKGMMDLPAVRVFKINTFFDMNGNGHSRINTDGKKKSIVKDRIPLSSLDWIVIGELQQDIPLTSRPFDVMGSHVGMKTEEFLAQCRSLEEREVMRRFGASVRHRNAGYTSNAMVCWVVPQGGVVETGQEMASFSEVSHCYERRGNQLWPYNLYTMIHGRTKQECQSAVERISEKTGIKEYEVLQSVREFKKERVKYRVPGNSMKGSSYYPIFLDVGGKRCVVIGGGEVALRKVRMMVEHAAHVEVISPELCPELNGMVMEGAVSATLREYKPGDLKGAFIVIAATDNSEINAQVADEAEERGILINVVDVPKLSNFIVPSYLRRGDVAIAVSTGGKSPALARKIRSELESRFSDEYAALAVLVDEVRSELKNSEVSIPPEAWQQALDVGTLLEYLQKGQRDTAKKRLLESLWRHE